jgi:hypothetical protein
MRGSAHRWTIIGSGQGLHTAALILSDRAFDSMVAGSVLDDAAFTDKEWRPGKSGLPQCVSSAICTW